MVSRRELGGYGGALIAAAAVGKARAAAPAAGEPVKFGVLVGLTGPSAVAGNACYQCMQIAADEVNAAGGVLGRPIKLIVQDDEGRPKAAVDAANLLSDVEKVPLAIGGYSSSTALPAGQVFNQKSVIWITDATTNKLKTVGPYCFDTAGLADQAAGLVDFVKADHPGDAGLKLAGIFENNPIGQDRDTVSRERTKELGLAWQHSMLYQVGAGDFRAELQKLIDSKPDAILTDVYDNDAQVMQKQLYELGMTDYSTIYSYNLSAYSTLDPKLTDGMKGLDYVTAGPRAEEFVKRYVARFGKPPSDAWAPPFYDAVWIAAIAVNMANSLELSAHPRHDVARRLSHPRRFRTGRQGLQHVRQTGGGPGQGTSVQGRQAHFLHAQIEPVEPGGISLRRRTRDRARRGSVGR